MFGKRFIDGGRLVMSMLSLLVNYLRPMGMLISLTMPSVCGKRLDGHPAIIFGKREICVSSKEKSQV